MKTKTGKLIVIEGSDGSGKTVQWEMLGEFLKSKNYNVKFFDFPDYSKASAGLIHNYLRDMFGKADSVSPYIASVFYAVNRYDAAYNKYGNMREALESGAIGLSNRYVPSNGGHQGGKIKDEEKLRKFLRWLWDFEFNILELPKPDLNVFLNVPFEISKKLRENRGSTFRDSHESDEQHLINAERAYQIMVREFPEDFVVIECIKDGKLLSKEQIHGKIVSIVSEKLGL